MLNDWSVDRTLTRKLMQALGSMGPAACLFALAADQGANCALVHQSVCCAVELRVAEHPSALQSFWVTMEMSRSLYADLCPAGEGHGMVQSVALLSATLALGGCQSAGLGSNHQDIAPRWAGILFGITNACASIIGIGGIIGTGAHPTQHPCTA